MNAGSLPSSTVARSRRGRWVLGVVVFVMATLALVMLGRFFHELSLGQILHLAY